MDLNSMPRSPREEGELEDGEICDDETDENQLPQQDMRPSSANIATSTRCSRKQKPTARNQPPLVLAGPPQDFRSMIPFSRGPHVHGPFPAPHRQQIGPSGPDRLLPGQDQSPRSSFWERSHNTLGRLRYRGKSNDGREDWGRGGWGEGSGGGRENGRNPPGRFSFAENHANRKDSPTRKQKPFGRPQARKQMPHNAAKPENGVDESFEILLMKYKQIQLELECIRKEEKMALEPSEGVPHREMGTAANAAAQPAPDGPDCDPNEAAMAAPSEESSLEKEEKKVFQAFNIKPLRQKLLTPAERDALNSKEEKEPEKKDGEKENEADPGEPTNQREADEEEEEGSESDLNVSSLSKESDDTPVKVRGRDEDDELSELQLRLLALQSASRKWQQKEQQVMRESQEKITKARASPPPDRTRMTTRAAAERARAGQPAKPQERGRAPGKPGGRAHPARKTTSPGAVAKQAWRKQQVRNWKLQQEAQLRWRQDEEEERRKREEEIRQIRDLANQDEQYNRFMKLVGNKHHPRSKSADGEHRKSLSKQGLDATGSLYQYDNYDEVAMDTDSETNSQPSSPIHDPFSVEASAFLLHMPHFSLDTSLRADLGQHYLDPLAFVSSTPPPPLPPLPPPPDDAERPPKPPFADEEEEEEMLLREELLKSLANKRALKAEDVSGNSGPPSPVVRAESVPAAVRSNLSAVSLNMVAALTRAPGKFNRSHLAPRPPLVLPRHKAVVVQLNASDDSDSESEASSSTQSVFGGLESMIKEARRTAEAAKPKASEKENKPMRTLEPLPAAKRAEYRLLKEEIVSRERQRLLKMDPPSGAASPVGSDTEQEPTIRATELQLADAQDKLTNHRMQLQKDEALLKHLLLQELKKKEALKAAEAKVSRLKEQLLASEKIASANRLLLKKLQEQVHRVQHRVVLKRHQAVRLERDVDQAQSSACRAGYKRKNTSLSQSPGKLVRVDGLPRPGSERHYAELIAQKRRLQQLESEYALKIQKLKEAQALRQAEPRTAPQAPAPPGPFPLPQPSLHDLTQDKLALTSGDGVDDDEAPPPAAPSTAVAAVTVTPGKRRRSFRESGSFTKPKLRHPEACPPTPTTPTTATAAGEGPAKPARSGAPPAGLPEVLLLGLTVEELRRKSQELPSLEEVLQDELCALEGAVEKLQASGKVFQVDPDALAAQQNRGELRPVPFGPYRSPLLVFKSYRFSPYFRTKEKLSLSSVSHSNAIEPKKCFCRFDLTGTCNDDDCRWQHMRNCTLTGNQLFQDILSFSLPLIGCSESSSTSEISRATEKYLKKLFGGSKDRVGIDQKAVLLVSKVNESLKHIPPYTTHKEKRRWRPEPQRSRGTAAEEKEEEQGSTVENHPLVQYDGRCQVSWSALDVCVTQDDKRYFVSETDDISNLETSVLESPKDMQLWVKLAYKYLSQRETSPGECLDAALNTLARALEESRQEVEVWCLYLPLFASRGSRQEVQEMCEMAVLHAPDYRVWWSYMSLESTFEGKDFVCGRLLQFLLESAEGADALLLSFRLLEALLFRVQLSVFTGRLQGAMAILQGALKESAEPHLAARLAVPDRCLLWLSYVHLTEFGRLPPSLFDPAAAHPAGVVSTKPFALPWSLARELRTEPDLLIALLQDAVQHCTDASLSPGEGTLACMPLHTNLLSLLRTLGRYQEAVSLCESLLSTCPQCCPLLEVLCELHLSSDHKEAPAEVWGRAHARHPHDAQIFYHLCKCLIAQGRCGAVGQLCGEFVLSLCEPSEAAPNPLDVLRHILGIPIQDLHGAPKIKAELVDVVCDRLPYLSLVHCLWQCADGSVDEAVGAFERALGTVTRLDVVQHIWLEYFLFSSSEPAGPEPRPRELKTFADLVQRCLVTMPTRLTVPFGSAQYWSDYSFHNQVVSLYLDCLPQSQHSVVLERLRNIMPSNTELAMRCVRLDWRHGNVEHARLQSRMLTAALPHCLATWRIAIAVERELKGREEVRRLYQQALQKLPLCATLWKDCLLFEAAEGGKTDTLRALVEKCGALGVSLTHSLTLEPSTAEGDDH